MKQFASIFNDVLGPVMRGPSSSHTACSVRIGALAREMAGGSPAALRVEFEPKGSLAATYRSQGVDVGLAAGLLGMAPDAEGLMDSLAQAQAQGVSISFHVTPFQADHPNTYRLTVTGRDGQATRFTALSVGGGMLRVVEIEDFPLLLEGGFYELLLFFERDRQTRLDVLEKLLAEASAGRVERIPGPEGWLIRLSSPVPVESGVWEAASALLPPRRVLRLSPVLPTPSQLEPGVPFTSMEEMLSARPGRALWEIAVEYEARRGGQAEAELLLRMEDILAVMERGVETGLRGTEYRQRLLGSQSHRMLDPRRQARMIPDPLQQRIIANISAIMETKSSMGPFAAAPTAGSCGCLAGTVLAAAQEMGLGRDAVVRALFAAGAVGVLIAQHSTFAAEVAGCQAECGAGSGMTAAALVELAGGTAREAADAASMALQNVFGMVCDPVAGGVEVPCLGKNIMCGLNALASANMALAGFDAVIPLDETIVALDRVGRMLPRELRCTGLEGLTITDTGKRLARRLAGEGGCGGCCC